jgi:hypothetical protein
MPATGPLEVVSIAMPNLSKETAALTSRKFSARPAGYNPVTIGRAFEFPRLIV